MALVAVAGCSIETLAPTVGNVEITSSPSSLVKIDEKGVYFGSISVRVTGASVAISETTPTGATNGVGVGTLTGTGSHMVDNDNPVVRVGDSSTIHVVGETIEPPGNPAEWNVVVRITAAGQSAVDLI